MQAYSEQTPLHQDNTHKIYFKSSTRMNEVSDNSVHLIVTSPPYWNIKDYGHPKQIGYKDSLPDYFKKLNKVWSECVRTLAPGCRLCVNIGDQYLRATKDTPYQIIPLHAMLVNNITNYFKDVLYLGSIIWSKIPNTKTSGGASVMGSYGRPRNGYVSYNYEYIAIFKKKGKDPKPDEGFKERSAIDLQEWRELFNGIWAFNGARQVGHIATFPDELPKRLMRMFTFESDTVLDPFLGSGTTSKVAWEQRRNSIGYEIGFDPRVDTEMKELVKQKIHYYDTPIEQRRRVFPTLI
jgi:site-specific DNA-methyltransferase (adenine-specific)